MSDNLQTRIENNGFTEQYNELNKTDEAIQQQCNWIDGKHDYSSPSNMDSGAQTQPADTDEEDSGPSYVDRVEQFLEKVFGGITANTDNGFDKKI